MAPCEVGTGSRHSCLHCSQGLYRSSLCEDVWGLSHSNSPTASERPWNFLQGHLSQKLVTKQASKITMLLISLGPESTLPRRTSKIFSLFHPQWCSQSDQTPGHSKQGNRLLRHQVEKVGKLVKPNSYSGNWVTGERSPTAALVYVLGDKHSTTWAAMLLVIPIFWDFVLLSPKWDSTVKVLVPGHTSVLSTALITARSFVPHLSSPL